MPITDTPLRYPGGKTQLTPLIIDILRDNDLFYGDYAEAFAGGAGIAWRLLVNGYVSNIYINDLDPAIYAFWFCVLNRTDELCKLIKITDITILEWQKQRIIQDDANADILSKGFSTLFLNRTNRSGIIRGGVIGGIDQTGNYKINCRFNKLDLVRKIERIAKYKEQVYLTNLDALDFIKTQLPKTADKTLVNLDPPYYLKGPGLYTNFYGHDDHADLAKAIQEINRRWIVTYDDEEELRKLYGHYPMYKSELNYSAQIKRVGSELLILDPQLIAPEVILNSRINSPKLSA